MTSRGAAVRYARALFDVAQKEANIEDVGREVSAFASVVAGHELLSRVLSNPVVPAPRKRAVVQDLLARSGTVSPVVSKLLLLLAERDRLVLLPEIDRAYQARLMDHADIVRAELTTAVALPEERVAELRNGLATVTGRQVQLETKVNPAIIGGAVARIGSTVYDGSITTQLQKVKERLSSVSE
ncbi:MAG: ATP synthase F1 subunit delta [Acidobacteria bacterium]|nr:ATP synthase F1 subunit delta [Acidobacteriota bacterium]